MTLATPKKEVGIGACSKKYRGGCGYDGEAIRPFGGCSYGPWLMVGVLGSLVWGLDQQDKKCCKYKHKALDLDPEISKVHNFQFLLAHCTSVMWLKYYTVCYDCLCICELHYSITK